MIFKISVMQGQRVEKQKQILKKEKNASKCIFWHLKTQLVLKENYWFYRPWEGPLHTVCEKGGAQNLQVVSFSTASVEAEYYKLENVKPSIV